LNRPKWIAVANERNDQANKGDAEHKEAGSSDATKETVR
jgi:hypothetical protein